MNRNVPLCLAMFMVIVLVACTQSMNTSKSPIPFVPSEKWAVELTLANEGKPTTVFMVLADGVEVLRKEIEGTEKGYFGQEISISTLALENRAQVLEVRTGDGISGKIKIEPGKGKYVAATFWTNRFVIEQVREKQQRFD